MCMNNSLQSKRNYSTMAEGPNMEQAVKGKLKQLLPAEYSIFSSVIDANFAFEEAIIQTFQLRSLGNSTAKPLNSATQGGEGTAVSACNIANEEAKNFLGIYGLFDHLYIRHGYDDLYDAIREKWREPESKSVVLLGNAGTGKSWYQIYALRRLLQREAYGDADEYDFVFREVGTEEGSEMSLIDIKEMKVYEVTGHEKELMQYLERCLYFFEPGINKTRSPSFIMLPSLATLSPNKERIKEYMKASATTLYFWPWLFTELMALCGHAKVFEKHAAREEQRKLAAQEQKDSKASGKLAAQEQQASAQKQQDSKVAEAAATQEAQKDAPMEHDDDDTEMDDVEEPSKPAATPHEGEEEGRHFNELVKRYEWFGGIVRHIVAANKADPKKELDNCLQGLKLEVLQSTAANIDSDVTGNNVSGYILCYEGKQAAMDARSTGAGVGFDKCVLGYTSLYVEEEVEKVLNTKQLMEKMEFVRDKLNGSIADLSAKNLEAVATEFLRNKDVQWSVKRAGFRGAWRNFKTTTREVKPEYEINGFLTKPGLILVPTNTSFPVGDMVFSNWGNDPVYVVQCTWQETHPFTVRALFQLRSKKLNVPHSKKVHILFIVPKQEYSYVGMAEEDFLNGTVDQPLLYSKKETVPATVLQEMWSNTEVHILCPGKDWLKMIGDWIAAN